mmetsp:Transcript_17340/g.33119  ORF Transcript_17340/g.33119 Transcript_17340/m.33119 type:complete len:214 (+) Transcript_17340:1883-2524(+)
MLHAVDDGAPLPVPAQRQLHARSGHVQLWRHQGGRLGDASGSSLGFHLWNRMCEGTKRSSSLDSLLARPALGAEARGSRRQRQVHHVRHDLGAGQARGKLPSRPDVGVHVSGARLLRPGGPGARHGLGQLLSQPHAVVRRGVLPKHLQEERAQLRHAHSLEGAGVLPAAPDPRHRPASPPALLVVVVLRAGRPRRRANFSLGSSRAAVFLRKL